MWEDLTRLVRVPDRQGNKHRRTVLWKCDGRPLDSPTNTNTKQRHTGSLHCVGSRGWPSGTHPPNIFGANNGFLQICWLFLLCPPDFIVSSQHRSCIECRAIYRDHPYKGFPSLDRTRHLLQCYSALQFGSECGRFGARGAEVRSIGSESHIVVCSLSSQLWLLGLLWKSLGLVIFKLLDICRF